MPRAALTDSHARISMGMTADNLAKRCLIYVYTNHSILNDTNLIISPLLLHCIEDMTYHANLVMSTH